MYVVYAMCAYICMHVHYMRIMCTMDPCTQASSFVFNCTFSLYARKTCLCSSSVAQFFFDVLLEIPFATFRSFSSWNGDSDDYDGVAVCWHPSNAFHSYQQEEKCSWKELGTKKKIPSLLLISLVIIIVRCRAFSFTPPLYLSIYLSTAHIQFSFDSSLIWLVAINCAESA